jgi:RPA family protein
MIERGTAVKLRIKDVVEASFHRSSERFEPNYIVTKRGVKASRVRVMGVVVAKFVSEDGKYSSITLDDASATIAVRAFREVDPLVKVSVGDTVDVVGKVKEYEDEIYILAETVRVLEDPNWELVRELELAIAEKLQPQVEAPLQEVSSAGEVKESFEEPVVEEEVVGVESAESAELVELEEKEEPKLKVLHLIEELDDGDGVKYITLLKESGLAEEKLEEALNELLNEGEIYEPKIGRFKRV